MLMVNMLVSSVSIAQSAFNYQNRKRVANGLRAPAGNARL